MRIDWEPRLIYYLASNAATFMATGATGHNGPSTALLLIIASAAVLLGTETARFFRRDA